MSNAASRDDDFIGMGDVVEHRMNTNVFGIVIGHMGSLVGVRVSPSLTTMWFHEWELQVIEGDDEMPPAKEATDDNVIDFTRAKELRAETKTKGAA